MEKLKNKWTELSWAGKLFFLILLHLIINTVTSIIFFLDDFSLMNQIVHSCLHLIFFMLSIKIIYIPNKEYKLAFQNIKWWIGGFIFLNLIPFPQGFEPSDNGFAPMWAMAM